jgi:hypothetical protein
VLRHDDQALPGAVLDLQRPLVAAGRLEQLSELRDVLVDLDFSVAEPYENHRVPLLAGDTTVIPRQPYENRAPGRFGGGFSAQQSGFLQGSGRSAS